MALKFVWIVVFCLIRRIAEVDTFLQQIFQGLIVWILIVIHPENGPVVRNKHGRWLKDNFGVLYFIN
jgi:hypothetical protein